MSVPYYGDFPEDAPVYIPFNTFSSDDPSASVTISNLADTDIYYHKNGSDTDYSADAATLVDIDFDGITGNHMLAIATSENAYFATGSEIAVRMEGTTVDGATINAFIGAFSIERAGGVLATLKTLSTQVGTAGAGLTDLGGMSTGMKAEVEAEATDALEADGLDHLVAAAVTGTDIADDSIIAMLVDDAATADWDNYDNTTGSLEALNVDTDAIKAETALIVADTDVIDDGTSGLVKIAQDVAAVLTDTGSTLDGKINTIDTNVDSILADTGTDGVVLKAAGLAADAVDEILDEVIEGSTTLRQAIKIIMSALAAKVSGGGTTTITFRDIGDSKDRITATVDADGNRTAVTLDGS